MSLTQLLTYMPHLLLHLLYVKHRLFSFASTHFLILLFLPFPPLPSLSSPLSLFFPQDASISQSYEDSETDYGTPLYSPTLRPHVQVYRQEQVGRQDELLVVAVLQKALRELPEPCSQPNSDSDGDSASESNNPDHHPQALIPSGAGISSFACTQEDRTSGGGGGGGGGGGDVPRKRRKVRLSNWRRKLQKIVAGDGDFSTDPTICNSDNGIANTRTSNAKAATITPYAETSTITSNNKIIPTTNAKTTTKCTHAAFKMQVEIERVGMFYCDSISRRPIPKNRIFCVFSNPLSNEENFII